MSSPAEQVKERLNIVDVVSAYVSLKRAGRNYTARCPFHTEKTPSFFVSPERNTFHCFGCGKGGDAFTFVQEMEGLDFKGALRLLADKAGVPLAGFDKKKADKTERLRALLEDATVFFQKKLVENKEALSYLYGRGASAGTLKEFRVGFAPDSWDAVTAHLAGKGYTEAEMKEAGMAIRGKRGVYDRFRSRVIFPISDASGRVVGFSGRIFGRGEKESAKYINTPETPLFDKSRVFYGYDKAKDEIRTRKAAVIVEGQMDVLLSHEAGVGNVVAVSGTAFSDYHAATLARLAEKIVFAFDADSAGLSALLRAARIALRSGADVRAVSLPEGEDPADCAHRGAQAWKDAIGGALPVIAFFLARIEKEGGAGSERRRRVREEVLPLIASVPGGIERAHYVSETAAFLGVPDSAVEEDVSAVRLDPFSASLPLKEEKRDADALRSILVRAAALILFAEQSGYKEEGERLRARMKSMFGESPPAIDIGDRQYDAYAFETERLLEKKEFPDIAEEIFSRLERKKLESDLADASAELRKAEREGRVKDAEKLLSLCADIAEKLSKIH